MPSMAVPLFMPRTLRSRALEGRVDEWPLVPLVGILLADAPLRWSDDIGAMLKS